MKQLTFPAVCMIASLAVTPAMSAPPEKPGSGGGKTNTECTYKPYGKAQSGRQTKRQGKRMDCVVSKGYPSQDGRETLRRSLTEEAKKGLSKTELPSLRDLIRAGKGRTS